MTWEMMSKAPIPNTLRVVPSTGSGTLTYAQIDWQIIEKRNGEIRTRVEKGKPVYTHDRPDLYPFFKIAEVVITHLWDACLTEDGCDDA